MRKPISYSSDSTFGLWRCRKCGNCRLLASTMPHKVPENSRQRGGMVQFNFSSVVKCCPGDAIHHRASAFRVYAHGRVCPRRVRRILSRALTPTPRLG